MGFRLHASFFVGDPFAILYEIPEQHSPIEDIIPYGAKVEITEQQGNWAFVTLPGSFGWIYTKNLFEAKEVFCPNAWVGHRGSYVFDKTDTTQGPFLDLPFETALEIIEEPPQDHQRWVRVRLQDGRLGYMQRSQILFSRPQMTLPEVVEFSRCFLGTKYLWGGATSFGYDCSGFVQMLYRQMGVILPRNARQQVDDPRLIKVQEAQAGDLVFFRNASGKVVHVAMMLDRDVFIHAFTRQEAWVCIHLLSDERFCDGHFYHGIEIRRLPPS
jgi:hypothetical protein